MNNIGNVKEENCCGCGACVQICPQKCISFIENDRGFLIPKINKEKCINCGLCKKSCPELAKEMNFNEVKEAYAAVIKNTEQQKKSTSGGIFYVLAENILQEGGIVFGVTWNAVDEVSHIAVKNIDDLEKISQSKYVQSNTQKTFFETKKFLDENKKVLYSGTACQIAGLKKFLLKDYQNLYTVEVACHGVPSPGLFKKYIRWREKRENSRIIEYFFRNRDKHPGGEHYKAKAKFENGKIKYYSIRKDPYYSAFLNGVTLRETCYECKYKKKKRIADITLCDFWGIEKEKRSFPAYFGCSAVLLNSEKAEKIFENITEKIIFERTDEKLIYLHNNSLINSCKKNNKNIFENIKEDDDIFFKKITLKSNLKSNIKAMIKACIPYKILYKLRRWEGK